MAKYTVLIQFAEPESAGGTLHNPGEVADLDPVKVFDLDELIAQSVVSPATEDAPASTGKASKFSKPVYPPQEGITDDQS